MTKPRRRYALPLLILIASLLVCAAGAYAFWSQMRHDDEQPKDMQGNAVSVQDGDLPSGDELKRMHVNADDGIRLVVPSVGLNAPVGSLSETGGQITPPGFTSAYIVRNRGAGGTDNAAEHTLFVVTHSVNWGKAPGNYLIDAAAGKPSIGTGTRIRIGTLEYTVTGATTVNKTELGSTTSVWRDSPGRLVLITCLQREQGKSLKNVVITAQLQ